MRLFLSKNKFVRRLKKGGLMILFSNSWTFQYGELLKESVKEAEKEKKKKAERQRKIKEQDWIKSIEEEAFRGYLIHQYDELDIDLLEDDDKFEANAQIIQLFVCNIFNRRGRKTILNALEKLEHETEYTGMLADFLSLINDICQSRIVREEDEDGKKVYPFGLNNKKVQDFLTDDNNNVAYRMSKVIDCTDNLIDRLSRKKKIK